MFIGLLLTRAGQQTSSISVWCFYFKTKDDNSRFRTFNNSEA